MEEPAAPAIAGPLSSGPNARLVDGLFLLVEVAAALLVLGEVLILGAGVLARYVFHRPIIWSDEVAVIGFLWIAMLGSAIAARSHAHMRLTVVVNRLPRGVRGICEATAGLMTVLLLALLVVPAIHHVQEHWDTLTPALRMSDGLRTLPIVLGLMLMLIASAPLLWAQSRKRDLLVGAAILLVIGLGLWSIAPWLRDAGYWPLAIFFVLGIGVTILAGVPIAFAFGICTVAYIQFSTKVPMTIVIGRLDGGISELLLLSIPLFILLGYLVDLSGMARALINLLSSLFGHVRGGLNFVLLGAMFLVSGISGSKAADMAAVAPVLVPEMKKRGYQPSELVALLATSGGMSETIPPSLVLIALGAVAGISIAALFTGGLVPAAIAALALVIVAMLRSGHSPRSGDSRASGSTIARSLLAALPVLALPLLIRVAVVEGVATATEVATIGIAYAVLIAICYGQFKDGRRLYRILVDTASLSGVIMLILGMATAMAWALTQSGVSQDLVDIMTSVPGGSFGFLVVSIVIFALLGSLLEGLPALVVLAPLLFPAAQLLGIHDVHYAMVIILSMGLGLFAPPFGVGYYMACVISNVPPDEGMKAIWPYLGALAAATVVVAAFPWLSTGFL